ncbi:MAG: hypothetical protein ACRBG0_24075 [Lewinella sp.]|jgi:hypothetical protein|uniref:hypothetical protein n=1 Tax=Lewinella sp. TaxID=2004506 RepID=UPI003D6A95B6
MREYTEIEIVDSLKDIDSILAIRSHVSFLFEDNRLSRRFIGGSPISKVGLNTIKFLTQGHYEGVSLGEIKPGTKLELFEGGKKEVKISDAIIQKRYFEKPSKKSWSITEEINPSDCILYQLEIRLSNMDKECLELGKTPLQMEDKWFSFVENNVIRFFRSWTGIEVFQAEILQIAHDNWVINELRSTKNPKINFQDKKSLFEDLVKYQIMRIEKIIK